MCHIYILMYIYIYIHKFKILICIFSQKERNRGINIDYRNKYSYEYSLCFMLWYSLGFFSKYSSFPFPGTSVRGGAALIFLANEFDWEWCDQWGERLVLVIDFADALDDGCSIRWSRVRMMMEEGGPGGLLMDTSHKQEIRLCDFQLP